MTPELDSLMAPKPTASNGPAQRKIPRIEALVRLIPLALIVAFTATLVALYGEHLIPSVAVTVVTPVVTVSDFREDTSEAPSDPSGVPSTQALFQASGWIEAEPFPHRAYTLAEGVVDRVWVLEGERIEQGQTLVTLVDEDARLKLASAEALLAKAEADFKSMVIERESLEHEYQLALARVTVEESRIEEIRDIASRLELLTHAAVAEQEITQAQLKLATQGATLKSAMAAVMPAKSQRERGDARIAAQQAVVDHARNEHAMANLNLDRMRIAAPVSGIIQRLTAAPGEKKMLGSDMPDSHVVALIYDPAMVQARIDVPLEEASKLQIGQQVRVRSGLLPQRTFQGQVTRIVGEADLQRNTLQVKVRILDPDPALRPDMLCRGEFFQKSSNVQGLDHRTSDRSLQLYLPAEAVIHRDGSSSIWRVSADRKRVDLVPVRVAEAEDADFVRILSGLAPGDPVVLNPPAGLQPHSRIRITHHHTLSNP